MEGVKSAKYDAYGGLYLYLQKLLEDFCRRLASLRLDFTLTGSDAKELPGVFETAKLAHYDFDRIEVRCLMVIS